MDTDTHNALLNAILANPEADLPRLVMADFLEESGRAERAEFIRIQCEWHGRFDEAPPDVLARHNDLWHRFEFSEPSETHAVWPYRFWRRGFVAEWHCELGWWIGRPCRVCRRRHVGSVSTEPWEHCATCHGSAIPAGGPKMSVKYPIEKVVVTDQSADVQWGGRGETRIWRRHLNDFDDRMPGFLPPSVWESNHISEAVGPTGARLPKRFSSQEDAQAALSDALIAWAKEQKRG